MTGGPDWIYSDRFDIAAKGEGEPPPEQMRSMLQTLATDRFKLVVHHEIRTLPVYGLPLAKEGNRDARLKTAAQFCEDPREPPGHEGPKCLDEFRGR